MLVVAGLQGKPRDIAQRTGQLTTAPSSSWLYQSRSSLTCSSSHSSPFIAISSPSSRSGNSFLTLTERGVSSHPRPLPSLFPYLPASRPPRGVSSHPRLGTRILPPSHCGSRLTDFGVGASFQLFESRLSRSSLLYPLSRSRSSYVFRFRRDWKSPSPAGLASLSLLEMTLLLEGPAGILRSRLRASMRRIASSDSPVPRLGVSSGFCRTVSRLIGSDGTAWSAFIPAHRGHAHL
jgi:hypothetical protein